MFPAVVSIKLEAAIEIEEERKRKRIQEEKGGEKAGDKKGKPASEFELLLNEYSKIEADEITVGAWCGGAINTWHCSGQARFCSAERLR